MAREVWEVVVVVEWVVVGAVVGVSLWSEDGSPSDDSLMGWVAVAGGSIDSTAKSVDAAFKISDNI